MVIGNCCAPSITRAVGKNMMNIENMVRPFCLDHKPHTCRPLRARSASPGRHTLVHERLEVGELLRRATNSA